jgi:small-conductance mechanosensitive channel/CRP-like cAMP-binding protein
LAVLQVLLDELEHGSMTPFGGLGIAIVALLLIGCRAVLEHEHRSWLVWPSVFLGVHVSLLAVAIPVPDAELHHSPIRFFSLTLLLLAGGRAGFLLIMRAVVGRRRRVPVPQIIQDIGQVLVYFGVLFAVLRAAGVELGSLLTTSALVTAVIGLSLQETLGNLFAGLAIQAQRPFEVGDWIQVGEDATSVGRVVEINWRATRIHTIDQVEITVPNGALARSSMRNYSRPTDVVRRSVLISLGATFAPAEAHKLFLAAVADVPGVLKEPPPDALTIGFSDRGVDYRIRYYLTEFDRREPIDSLVRDRIWYALSREGHEIPGANRTVFLHETGRAAREEQREEGVARKEVALRAVHFLAGMPDGAIHMLAEGAQRRVYTVGETIIREGEPGNELFVLLAGEVEVLVGRDSGGKARVATLGPLHFFGEMSLMTGEPRRATIRAMAPTTLLVIGKRELSPVLLEHPELAETISRVLAERELHLDSLTERSDEERTSLVLVRSGELLTRIRTFFSLGRS